MKKFQLELKNKYDALGEEILDEGNSWERLRDALMEAANKVVPIKRKKGKQKWMTADGDHIE